MSFPKEFLSATFEDRGLDYDLILSSEYAALYEVTGDDEIIAYDVFKLDELQPLVDDEYVVYYPTDEAFFQGIDTFTLPVACVEQGGDEEEVFIKAILKFKELGYE